jgi:hypothetical protein
MLPLCVVDQFVSIYVLIFFERNTVGEAPTVFFLIIRTQICVREDLNLGGWVVHSLP